MPENSNPTSRRSSIDNTAQRPANWNEAFQNAERAQWEQAFQTADQLRPGTPNTPPVLPRRPSILNLTRPTTPSSGVRPQLGLQRQGVFGQPPALQSGPSQASSQQIFEQGNVQSQPLQQPSTPASGSRSASSEHEGSTQLQIQSSEQLTAIAELNVQLLVSRGTPLPEARHLAAVSIRPELRETGLQETAVREISENIVFKSTSGPGGRGRRPGL